jgi:hypothetical protein
MRRYNHTRSSNRYNCNLTAHQYRELCTVLTQLSPWDSSNDLTIMESSLHNDSTSFAVDTSTMATLAITMTIQTGAKPKTRTKYRPTERSDGVIVLQRPYRPATLPHTQAPKFEKHLPTFAVATKTPKPIATTRRRREEDLAGIGSDLIDTGRDGYNGVVETGRGGYNDRCDGREEILNFLKDVQRTQDIRQMSPMQRFLGDTGPWSTFEV